jgi:hypothetical protein
MRDVRAAATECAIPVEKDVENAARLDRRAVLAQQYMPRMRGRDEALSGEIREVLEQVLVALRVELARYIVEQQNRRIAVRMSQRPRQLRSRLPGGPPPIVPSSRPPGPPRVKPRSWPSRLPTAVRHVVPGCLASTWPAADARFAGPRRFALL